MAGFPTLINNGWISVPWAEYISKTGATSDASLGYDDGNRATMSILLNWDDWVLYTPIRDLLGTNIFNRFASQIQRNPPARHPIYDSMYCSRIAGVRPMKWLGKRSVGGGPISSNYQFALVTLEFSQPKYVILSDGDLDNFFKPVAGVRQEWNRFVEVAPQPGQLVLSRDASAFNWASTSATGPALTKPFPSSLAQYLPQIDYVLVWHRVPYNGLISDTTGRPDNLLSVLNTVNNATFFGNTTGTILLKSARITVKTGPTQSSVTQNGSAWWPALACTVEFGFSYFSPPSGDGVNFGHNLAPFLDNKWYLVKDAKTNTTTIYPSGDLTTAFKCQA